MCRQNNQAEQARGQTTQRIKSVLVMDCLQTKVATTQKRSKHL
jgi:hypothetical protein